MDLKMSAKCYVFLHMDPSYIMGKNCSIYGSQKILGLACTLKMDQSKSFLCSYHNVQAHHCINRH